MGYLSKINQIVMQQKLYIFDSQAPPPLLSL